MKVLIADDSRSMREMLKGTLVEVGYEVVVTEDGRQAWEALRKGDLQLAVLDWVMPGMDGVEVCRKIRSERAFHPIHVILLTSKEGTENVVTALTAVETARAGEHGRGFAVVADEVRNLAQRSSTAAKDITALITDSVKKAESGTELVKKTREVFSGVVTQVKKVADLVNEIATASEEQTNGIEQISKAIQQMDQVVQQNAASAEETAAASEELSAQAHGLNVQVDKIVAEVNMEGDRGSTGVKPAIEKKETKQLKAKGSFIPANKNISSNRHTKDTPSEGNGKKLVMTGTRSNRLISLSNDEFKDF